MLTGIAQPTSLDARPVRRRLSAASGAFIAIVFTFVLLAAPNSASATAGTGGSGAWPWPLLGEVITPYKNVPDRYAAGQHRGLDIAAPVGRPVLAIVPGRVSFAGKLPDGGQTVTVRSADGRWLVSDLHLATRDVQRGDSVRPGARLGSVGTSGRRSAEPAHLHLSVRRTSDRAYVDPLTLLGEPRLASAAKAATPKIKALERPAARSADVRAHTTGGRSPAPRHGVQGRRTAASRSAGEHAHEGDAADGISRVAPPPISARTPTPEAILESARAEMASPAVPEPEAQSVEPDSKRPKRLLLLAIAAVCLVALVLRRRPRSVPPQKDDAEPSAEQADVIPFGRSRRSA